MKKKAAPATNGRPFEKILIANRGEIALRVIRACREMDILAVAVYSEADRNALHVRFADEAYCIGPAPSAESYLRIDAILDAAKKSGAQAIHPGYGFLAENAGFARACKKAGVVFIGPPPEAIEVMGIKTSARKVMKAANVPVVPGTEGGVPADSDECLPIAREIGYPIMIKADAGGGGKGMRRVYSEDEMAGALRGASSEAQASFGDATVYLEKYLEKPRHIEIQLMADTHGNVVHFGERECSIQRRHQKVIEECPSPVVSPEMRAAMGAVAVQAAKAVNYVGAGTVEFLADQELNFYFLEMNTRLQVEHPVTELVTGVDLVKLQFLVAAGEKLPLTQDDIGWTGSAIECRVYAEDPANNFLPSPGTISGLREPGGPGVRNDASIYQGGEISIYYDPLISKLCTWGRNRNEAIHRMLRALEEYKIRGIKTNIPFHQKVMREARFIAGDINTAYIDERLEEEAAVVEAGAGESATADSDFSTDVAVLAAALAAYRRDVSQAMSDCGDGEGDTGGDGDGSGWRQRGWKMTGRSIQTGSRL